MNVFSLFCCHQFASICVQFQLFVCFVFVTALHLHLVVYYFFIGLCHLQFIFSPFISLSVLSLNVSWVIICLFPVI